MKITKIVVASGNKGKIKEIGEILKGCTIIPMGELGREIDVEEDQPTFEGNARKKAEEIARALNAETCLADDSGIEIEYLEGFPGVKTKRWLTGTSIDRNTAIIEKLIGVPKEKRKIRWGTAIAISDGKETICVKGCVEGFVAETPRGENGFGFDTIFELPDGRTLAELTPEEKNAISARSIALESLRKTLFESKIER